MLKKAKTLQWGKFKKHVYNRKDELPKVKKSCLSMFTYSEFKFACTLLCV